MNDTEYLLALLSVQLALLTAVVADGFGSRSLAGTALLVPVAFLVGRRLIAGPEGERRDERSA